MAGMDREPVVDALRESEQVVRDTVVWACGAIGGAA